MRALATLVSDVRSRLVAVRAEKARGRKVVGYLPGGYLPEELVLASGAIPLGMIRSADQVAIEKSLEYICRWFDPFYRGQIAYLTAENDPFYSILDLLAVAITDAHCRSVCDTAAVFSDIPLFQFGVPHRKDDLALEYYTYGLGRLKERLESLTGQEITEERLSKATELCNRERALFRELSLMRKADDQPLTFQDYLALHHASFILDKEQMVEVLQDVLREATGGDRAAASGPRLLLTAATMAYGDTKVPRLVEEAGGLIVADEVAECVRPYWDDVSLDGDLLANIADTYFMKRVPPAWFRPGRERLDFICRLAREFRVDGVIWYHLMFREPYKMESYYFPDILRKTTGLGMLLLESDYGAMETGAMKTKIESYLHGLRKQP
jgi:benzoyl-CoA reductase/2-hydroxyglutaryl-CoA dehydratase subunit BcrC/BadD/HgdB